jgi:glyoxylase-like metal-dependent hydrolase (beta-lactamase superfamily II)
MELHEVASHVYACIVEDRGWGWSNSGLVNRGGGMVVDTFMDVRHTRALLELYATVRTGRPDRLVNTHDNSDHCWGNQLFGDAEIIGHRLCAEAMRKGVQPAALQAMKGLPDASPGVRWFAADIEEFDFSDVEVTPPNRLLEERLDLDLDGTACEVIYLGPAHTASDVVVHLPEEHVLFTGDLLFRLCTPIGWDGTFDGWMAALDRMIAMQPEVVVPGHGPLTNADGLLEFRAYLAWVKGESKRLFDQGLSELEAAKRIDPGPYADWTQPERIVFNVARAYRELRGEAWDAPSNAVELMDRAVELRAYWDAREDG